MKYIVAAMMLFFSSAAFAGDQYLVKLEGMSCPFCAHGVEKKVKEMKGVASAAVDLKASTVAIEMKDGATLPEADVKKAIADAGFSFVSLANITKKPADHPHKAKPSDDHS
jgi:copper chaperone CopZ